MERPAGRCNRSRSPDRSRPAAASSCPPRRARRTPGREHRSAHPSGNRRSRRARRPGRTPAPASRQQNRPPRPAEASGNHGDCRTTGLFSYVADMKPADIELLHVLGQPTVSPDGRFAVVPVIRPELESDEYRGHLWIVPTDGSAPPRPFTTGWRDFAPAYSPNGEWLAFLRASEGGPGGSGGTAKPQLYVMPTAGGEPRRVTDHPLGAGAPAVEPGLPPDRLRHAGTGRGPLFRQVRRRAPPPRRSRR